MIDTEGWQLDRDRAQAAVRRKSDRRWRAVWLAVSALLFIVAVLISQH